MKIGAHLYTVREFTQTNKDFAGTIKKLSQIGYGSVQVSSLNPRIPPEEVAETCRAYNIEVVATDTDPVRIINDTNAVIDEHMHMGAKYICIAMIPNSYSRNKDGFRRFVTDFIPAARAIKDEGLRLMYHNHRFEFERTEDKTLLEYMADKFPDIGFILDTFWIQAGGADPAEWIRKFAGRVDAIHLKDYAIVDDSARTVEIFEGNLNWNSIFAAARESGVKYALVEQDSCHGKDPFESLRLSLSNIKKFDSTLLGE